MRFVLPLALAMLAGPAIAADAEPASRPISFEAELAVVSDYRFRGLSLSDEKPAVQGGVTATLSNGAYGYVWASTIDEYSAGADDKGATVEVDFVLGWAGVVAGLDADISAQAYTYPGASGVNYVEFPITMSRRIGSWGATFGAAYAPSQRALGDEDNAYGWIALSHGEASPLQFALHLGYEDGAYAPTGKWDWSVGVSRDFGPLTAGLALVDSDDPGESGGLVASLAAAF